MSPQLKLIALDADDLAVISAHVQDARVQAADIIWRQGEKRLVVGMSRLDWEQTLAGETDPAPAGRRAPLRPGAGLQVAQHRPGAPDAALDLVGIEFHPGRRRPAAARCCCSAMAARSGSTSNAWNAS